MSNSENTLIIGVDGGGTGCRVAIGARSEGILAQADGGRGNMASDPDVAIRNVLTTVKAAAAKAGISVGALNTAVAHLGLAGVMTAKDSANVASKLPFAACVVTDDRPTAITGALGGEDGYLLSVGTGTIVASSKEGAFKYIGGWGFHVADQGSGAWLGRAALEQVLLCHDGLEAHSDLTRALLDKFDNDPNAIVSFSMSAKPGDFGMLAPEIVSAAHADDPWGRTLMQNGADYLMRGLAALAFKPGEVLCLSGGVGPHYAEYFPPELLSGQIARKGSALDGAFALALSGFNNSRGTNE